MALDFLRRPLKPLTIHKDEVLLAESPGAVLDEDRVEDGELAESPPSESSYRDADMAGITCRTCAHYKMTDEGAEGEPSSGECKLWEALVAGNAVCDRYTADEDLTPPKPATGQVADFAAAELFMPGESIELSEEDGFVVKTILRTGEWKKTPGTNGVRRQPLKIVRDGVSNIKEGIISLSELVESFDAKAYQYVTIPLSDDEKDHKNIGRLNTGFVREVWIEDGEDGEAKLKAKMHFTEPDVYDKVKRGTIPDVSAGIYGNVERSDGEKFNAAINHVCLTPRPFIDGMEPFGAMLSDDDSTEHPENIEGFVPAEEAEEAPDWDDRLSLSWQRERAVEALSSQFDLSDDYSVTDIAPERAIVTNKIAETSWVVPFKITDNSVELSAIEDWQVREEESDEGSEQSEEPAAAPEQQETVALSDPQEIADPLMQARRLRELRSRSVDNSEGGEAMPVRNAADPLEGIDLSDPDAVRAAMVELASENQQLRSSSRVSEVDAEIERVSELGFKEAPGFLRVYRDILLSDDDQPAMVLLSHDDKGQETNRERLTATEIAKKLIDSLPTEEKDGQTRVMLSAQHLTSGNDEPPPADETGESKSVEERTREAEIALRGKASSAEKED